MLHCISNTTCLVVTILFTICYDYNCTSFIDSSEIAWMNFANGWKCTCIRLLLLSGQLAVFDTPDINLSLSFPKSSHSNIKCSIVCSAFPQGHAGDSMACGYGHKMGKALIVNNCAKTLA
jgi:hypothetical protein